MIDNEKLIEEARTAVAIAKDSIWRTSPDADHDARHEAVLDRMLTLFEEAHTPSAEPGKLQIIDPGDIATIREYIALDPRYWPARDALDRLEKATLPVTEQGENR